MNQSSKVISNTGILYIRIFITICISLFSTRWLLKALGNEDFGLYNLIAGVISLFSFLNIAMSASTQRFLSFSIGQNNSKALSDIFYYSLIMHLIVGIIVILLFEIAGYIFITYYLVIPTGKTELAFFTLHCLTISSFLTVIAVPFNATLNAHEDIKIFALVNVMESILKFILAWFLLSYSGNRLKLYAILVTCITFLSSYIVYLYCRSHYQEVKIKIRSITNYNYFKQISSYSFWIIIGAICAVGRGQGLAILLNSFFGVIINTAYGITNQVNNQILFFSGTILRAIRPQIISSEGGGNRERMIRLSYTACKFSFILLSFIIIPLFIHLDYILKLWLNNIPQYTTSFCRLILIVTLINQITAGLFIANESLGKIKNYQIATSILDLLILPIGYILLNYQYPPQSVFWGLIVIEIISIFVRCKITHYTLQKNSSFYFTSTLIPCILISSISFLLCLYFSTLMHENIFTILLTIIINFICISILLYYKGMTIYEKQAIATYIKNIRL